MHKLWSRWQELWRRWQLLWRCAGQLAGLAGASLQSWHPTPATDVLLPPLPGPPHLQEKANVKDAKKDKKAERVRQ